jgi:hypothetical protein
MAEKTSQYTANATSDPIKGADLLDFSNEDGGGGFDASKKITVDEHMAYINANVTNYYNADGTLSGNRIITAPNLTTTWDEGTLVTKSDGINDNGFLVHDDLGVLQGGMAWDVSEASASLDLKDAIGSYFFANNGEVTARDGYSIGADLYFHNNGVINNVFVGRDCGENATGLSNSGMGINSLKLVTTGTSNTGVGSSTLSGITIGLENAAFGTSSLIALNSTAGNNSNTAIGAKSSQTLVTGTQNVSLGGSSGANVTGGTGNTHLGAVSGFVSSGSLNHTITIGRFARANASNQWVVGAEAGGAYINEAYLGRGVTTTVAALSSFTMNATGVNVGVTDGSAQTSIFNIAGGRGTGDREGGPISLQTAPSGATGSTQNPLVTALTVDTSNTAGDTRLLIYDVDNGTLERVTVGVADSGGAGFKVLRIAN